MFASIFQLSKIGLDVAGVKKNWLNELIKERNSSGLQKAAIVYILILGQNPKSLE